MGNKPEATSCFLRGTHGAQVHSQDPHLPPAPGAWGGLHHPLGGGVSGGAPPAKPERLVRALRSKTFQLTSAISPVAPAIALRSPLGPPPPGPPVSTAWPAPPSRATLSGRPEVSAERASLPPPLLRGLPRVREAALRKRERPRPRLRGASGLVLCLRAVGAVLCGCRQARR